MVSEKAGPMLQDDARKESPIQAECAVAVASRFTADRNTNCPILLALKPDRPEPEYGGSSRGGSWNTAVSRPYGTSNGLSKASV